MNFYEDSRVYGLYKVAAAKGNKDDEKTKSPAKKSNLKYGLGAALTTDLANAGIGTASSMPIMKGMHSSFDDLDSITYDDLRDPLGYAAKKEDIHNKRRAKVSDMFDDIASKMDYTDRATGGETEVKLRTPKFYNDVKKKYNIPDEVMPSDMSFELDDIAPRVNPRNGRRVSLSFKDPMMQGTAGPYQLNLDKKNSFTLNPFSTDTKGNRRVVIPDSWASHDDIDGIIAHELGHSRQGKLMMGISMPGRMLARSSALGAPIIAYGAASDDENTVRRSRNAALGLSGLSAGMVLNEAHASYLGSKALPKGRKVRAFVGVPTYAAVAAAPLVGYGVGRGFNYLKNRDVKNYSEHEAKKEALQ